MDISMTFVALLMLLWALLTRYLLVNKKKGRYYMIFFSLLYLYACLVMALTQFPIKHDPDAEQNVFRQMQLIPIITFPKTGVMTMLKDIFMLLPFGFLFPLLKRYTWKGMLFANAIFGAAIELIQLVIALLNGSTTRIVDINEVIAGVIGGMIGYGIYIGFEKLVATLLPEEDLLRKCIVEGRKGL